ncbi:hypothetical protein X953_03240 [Virgibacillus sp. SK37]|nr:hypothetical protein X953_03240 [Virgibacillus sp. SK37]
MQNNFSSQEWIKGIHDNCESVGVSKNIIERFNQFYMKGESVDHAKSTAASTGTENPSK